MLAAGQRLLGGRDPRWLTLTALLGLVVLVWLGLPEEHRPVALGALVLAPPVIFGAIFGSPAALVLPLLVAAACASKGSRPITVGVLSGLAAAVDPLAPVAVPFLLMPLHGSNRLRALKALAVTFGVLCLPGVLLDARAVLAALARTPDLSPGLGLINFILYEGGENQAMARAFLAFVPILAAAVVVTLRGMKRRLPPLGAAALAILSLLFLQPGVSPETIALPIGLAALSFLLPKPPARAL